MRASVQRGLKWSDDYLKASHHKEGQAAKHSIANRFSSSTIWDHFDPVSPFKDLKALHHNLPSYGIS